MEHNTQDNTYVYHYSSSEQEEIEKIRRKYMTDIKPTSATKMERLRRLDASVEKVGTIGALIVGVLGLLIFGFGMACILEWMGTWFVPGIVFGLVGITVMAAAYPFYLYLTARRRQKIASEVLALTEELRRL